MSCRVLSSAWPTCREPVTLGGGMTIEYCGFKEHGSALNNSSSTHFMYHLSSIGPGSSPLPNTVFSDSIRFSSSMDTPGGSIRIYLPIPTARPFRFLGYTGHLPFFASMMSSLVISFRISFMPSLRAVISLSFVPEVMNGGSIESSPALIYCW